MASNIEGYESSLDDGSPVELYRISCGGTTYMYTSRDRDVSIRITDGGVTRTETYRATYITRGELIPGSDGSQVETDITVAKDNAVAQLYQIAPPEEPVVVEIIRAHYKDLDKNDVMFYGWVTQASFEDSECTLSVQLESWLNKEIPNGMYQYSCNNILYDHNCRLNIEDYKINMFADRTDGITVYTSDAAAYPDGYFNNGKMYFDGQVRMIATHVGNELRLRYPFRLSPRNDIVVTPGCDKLFKTCVTKFNNADNFTGFPYCPPTDPEKSPTGKGTYWVDGNIVYRDTDGTVHTTGF